MRQVALRACDNELSADSESTRRRSEDRLYWVVSVLAVLLLINQAYNAVVRPLLLDEFATWWVVQGSLADAVMGTSPHLSHPLYYGLVWLVTTIAEPTALTIRLVGYVSFVITAVVLHRFTAGRYGIRWPILVAIFLILEPLPGLFYCYGRPYPLGILFSVAALVMSSKGLRLRASSLSFVFCSLAFLTHQSFVSAYLIPASVYLFQGHESGKRRLQWIAIFWACALVFIVTMRSFLPGLVSLEDVGPHFSSAFTWKDLLPSASVARFLFLDNLAIAIVFLLWEQSRQSRGNVFRTLFNDTDFKVGSAITLLTLVLGVGFSLRLGPQSLTYRYLLVVCIGMFLVMCAVIRTVNSSQIVLALLIPPLLAALSDPKGDRYDNWQAAIAAGSESKREEAVLSIVFSGHAMSRLATYNQTARMSSAWTSPIDFYRLPSTTQVTLPMVHDAINESQFSVYQLPWTSMDIQKFNRIEVYVGLFGPGVLEDFQVLKRALKQSCFALIREFSASRPYKYIFVRTPSECL